MSMTTQNSPQALNVNAKALNGFLVTYRFAANNPTKSKNPKKRKLDAGMLNVPIALVGRVFSPSPNKVSSPVR